MLPILTGPPKKLPKEITKRLRIIILERCHRTCTICGNDLNKDSSIVLHVGHKISKPKRGNNLSENLGTTCSL